ncbi:MAG TPA: glycosyltransferase family A protein [Anaerolineales bacterium]
MRIGQNPAKFVDHVVQPQKITVAVVSYIPFLGGYYAESLDVLQTCLQSIWEHTDLPYDLLVFDNASCPEVRRYLQEAQQQGRIQYLVLSEQNIGKGGAWNFIFGAAPGEIIAYADSDIYFYPGWLPALVQVLETFPEAGMVTGVPLWSPEEFSTATLEWAGRHPEAALERGAFLPWEDYWRHSRSLGTEEAKARAHFGSRQDIRLTYQGQPYYVGAGHFQFVARRSVLQSALPIPSDRPMGQVRSLDSALNAKGYLRLSTSRWWAQHLGNSLQGFTPAQDGSRPTETSRPSRSGGLWAWKPLRRMLVWLYNKTFDILYRS